MVAGRVGGLVGGLRYGAAKFSGFALSMLLLAVAALAVIPAMITASSPQTWGRIALGQSVGAVAAVLLAFGWGISGPASIARGSAASRQREFVESLVTRAFLALPVASAAAGLAWLLGGADRGVVTIAALTTSAVGLSANWYFVGLARPWTFLLLETVPRVSGSAAAIVVMGRGGGVGAGLLCQLGGLLLACVVTATWILRRRLAVAGWTAAVRSTPRVLAEQRHGLSASLVSAGYAAAPVVLVGALNPAVLPAFALVDKLQRQINAGSSAYVTVVQGWVPRGDQSAVRARTWQALGATVVLCVLGGIALFAVSEPLVHWLGGRQTPVSVLALGLMSLLVAVRVVESVVGRACLPALGLLPLAARATAVSAVAGLALVVVACLLGGVAAVLAATVIGLLLRVALELSGMARARSTGTRTDGPARTELVA